jgi:hypothetical protein
VSLENHSSCHFESQVASFGQASVSKTNVSSKWTLSNVKSRSKMTSFKTSQSLKKPGMTLRKTKLQDWQSLRNSRMLFRQRFQASLLTRSTNRKQLQTMPSRSMKLSSRNLHQTVLRPICHLHSKTTNVTTSSCLAQRDVARPPRATSFHRNSNVRIFELINCWTSSRNVVVHWQMKRTSISNKDSKSLRPHRPNLKN